MAEVQLASAEENRPLYDLLERVRDLAPWTWMQENQLFTVIDPDDGEPGFVSIMGAVGEHYAVSLYSGTLGLFRLLHVVMMGEMASQSSVARMLLDTPQLMASLEDREMLEKRDREQIKALGRKYRGRNAWPLFRSYRASFAPWFLEPAEVRRLAYALEQVLEVTPRVRDNPALLTFQQPAETITMLTRVPERGPDGLIWHDETRRFQPPSPQWFGFNVDEELVTEVSNLPKRNMVMEADCVVIPNPVAPPGERPYFPVAVFLVAAANGQPLGVEMLDPDPSADEMWASVGMATLYLIANVGFRPSQLRLRHPMLSTILSELAPQTGVKVEVANELNAVDVVVDGLLAFLTGDMSMGDLF